MALFERLKADAAEAWRGYVHHPFVCGLGDGTLPKDSFRHYLVQDYLFLIQFARAYALAAYKSHDLDGLRHKAAAVSAILAEMMLHVRLAAEWGESENNRRAKYYSLTAKGRKHFEAEEANLERLSKAISRFIRTTAEEGMA